MFAVSLVPSLAPVMHEGRPSRGTTVAGNLRGGRALKVRAHVSGAAVIVAMFASGCGAGGEVTTVTTVKSAPSPPATTRALPATPTQTRSAPDPAPASVARLGTSVEGTPIRATVIGDKTSPVTVLVVGCVHGDEPAGEAVVKALRGRRPPAGVALWLVEQFNPDGCQAGTRQNANGVDLNRNSPWRWRQIDKPGQTYYSGTGPLSEPESKAINRLVGRIQPAVSVWYHQHAALVDDSGGDAAVERRYAQLVGLPFKSYGNFPGSITSWQNAAFPGTTAFVVELPAGPLSAEAASRHADAVLALAAEAAKGAGGGPAAPAPGSGQPDTSTLPGTSAD